MRPFRLLCLLVCLHWQQRGVSSVYVGSINWTSTMANPITHAPVLSDDTLFVANGGELRALNTSDGAISFWWYYNEGFIVPGPMGPDGALYLSAASGQKIIVVDTTNFTVWPHPTFSAEASVDERGVLNEDGSMIYYWGTSGNLSGVFAMHTTNGSIAWRYFPEFPDVSDFYGQPVLATDNTYVVVAGRTSYWIDAVTGEHLNQEDNDATSVFNGADNEVCFSEKRDMRCYNYKSPTSVDISVLGDSRYIGALARGVASDELGGALSIYVGSESGTIVHSDDIPGSTWMESLGDPITAEGVLSPDGATFYVGSSTGCVYALDAATGDLTWKLMVNDGPSKHSVFTAPGVVSADGSLLYIGSLLNSSEYGTTNRITGQMHAINLFGEPWEPPPLPKEDIYLYIIIGVTAGVVAVIVIVVVCCCGRHRRKKRSSVGRAVVAGSQRLLKE